MPFLSLSQAARRLGVPPRALSDAFYQGLLRDDLCPHFAGRRVIPLEYLPVIAGVLKGRGRKINPNWDQTEAPAV
jgi:hypothetical protein